VPADVKWAMNGELQDPTLLSEGFVVARCLADSEHTGPVPALSRFTACLLLELRATTRARQAMAAILQEHRTGWWNLVPRGTALRRCGGGASPGSRERRAGEGRRCSSGCRGSGGPRALALGPGGRAGVRRARARAPSPVPSVHHANIIIIEGRSYRRRARRGERRRAQDEGEALSRTPGRRTRGPRPPSRSKFPRFLVNANDNPPKPRKLLKVRDKLWPHRYYLPLRQEERCQGPAGRSATRINAIKLFPQERSPPFLCIMTTNDFFR